APARGNASYAKRCDVGADSELGPASRPEPDHPVQGRKDHALLEAGDERHPFRQHRDAVAVRVQTALELPSELRDHRLDGDVSFITEPVDALLVQDRQAE